MIPPFLNLGYDGRQLSNILEASTMSLDPYFEPGQGGDNAFTVEAPKIKFGPGSLSEIGDDAKALGMTRVAFYTDSTVTKLEPVAIATKSLTTNVLTDKESMASNLGLRNSMSS